MYERNTFERYLREDEERRLFAAIARCRADVYARRDLAMMQLMRQTGIRVGSCAGLDCLDAREALRTERLALRPALCKRGRGYTVHANKKARAALRELLACRREMGHSEAPDDALIMSRHGKRIAIRSIQDRMRKWCAAAGLPDDVSPHWLRHTLAKRMLQRSTSNNPVAIVQRVLGQSSISSAAIYTMPDREEIEQAVEAAA
jgi:site-specific recombinase XerC